MDNEKNKNADVQLRQLKILKRQTFLIVCILVVVVAVSAFVAIQFSEISKTVASVTGNLKFLEDDTLNNAVESFTEAANQFNSIDVEEFNKTVISLQSAAENLKNVDMVKLNALVETLQSVADTLDRAVSGLAGIFGR